MMRDGIEVWGYRRNYEKAQEAYENGHVDGVTVDIKTLVQTVKSDGPGIFMMVVPAETVEDTLNELLLDCSEGDIIIDHGNSNFKDSRRRAERLEKLGIQYIDCGTSGGVYGLERGYCLMVGGSNTAVSIASPIFQSTYLELPLLQNRPSHKSSLVLSMGGCIVDHQVQVTL